VRTTNPIESTSSQAAGAAMAFQLIESAQHQVAGL
jgi:hypothetical protein